MSILGTNFIFLFVPVLAVEGDGSMKREWFTNFTTPLSIILSMGAATTTGLILSVLGNGSPKVRDIQNALLGGIVMSGSASYFITNPGYSILLGILAAMLQSLFDYCLEKPAFKALGLFTTYPSSVFSLQSIAGGIAMAILASQITINTPHHHLTYRSSVDVGSIFISCFISAGIGFFTGLATGLLTIFVREYGVDIDLSDE